MLDHIALVVKDYSISKHFFASALKPIGYSILMEYGEAAGLGENGKPDFWIAPGEVNHPTHIAFRAENRKLVDEFYQAAISAGGKDNGAPGLRPNYHHNYYGAFVIDPDGNNIEVVCHNPE